MFKHRHFLILHYDLDEKWRTKWITVFVCQNPVACVCSFGIRGGQFDGKIRLITRSQCFADLSILPRHGIAFKKYK